LDNVEGRDYHCFNESADVLTFTGVSVVQDLLACFLPSVVLWKLSLPIRQKVALASLFLVGMVTCACGIVRLYLIYQTYFQTYDVTWSAGTVFLWTALECTLGVIVASLPALRIYFRWATPASKRIVSQLARYPRPAQRRSYIKANEEANGSGTFVQTPTSTVFNGGKRNSGANDLELGNIEVTRAVPIEHTRRSPFNVSKMEDSVVHLTGLESQIDEEGLLDWDLSQSKFNITPRVTSDPPYANTSPIKEESRPPTSGSQSAWQNFSMPRRTQSVSLIEKA